MEIESKIAVLSGQIDLISRKLDIIMSVMGINLPGLPATGPAPHTKHCSGEAKCFRVFQNNVFESCDSICCGSHYSFDSQDAPTEGAEPAANANVQCISESDCTSPNAQTNQPKIERDRTSFHHWVQDERGVGEETAEKLLQYSQALHALERKCEEFDFPTARKSEKSEKGSVISRSPRRHIAAITPPEAQNRGAKTTGVINQQEVTTQRQTVHHGKKWVRERNYSLSSTRSSNSVGSVGVRREEMTEFMKGVNAGSNLQTGQMSVRTSACPRLHQQHKHGRKVDKGVSTVEERKGGDYRGDSWNAVLDGSPEDQLKKLSEALDVLNRTGFSCKGANLTEKWGKQIEDLMSGMRTNRERAMRKSGREALSHEKSVMKWSPSSPKNTSKEGKIKLGSGVQQHHGEWSARKKPVSMQPQGTSSRKESKDPEWFVESWKKIVASEALDDVCDLEEAFPPPPKT